MSTSQEEFDALIRSFNEEYVSLLRRAADGDFGWLVLAFTSLRDLHDLILATHDVGQLAFRVPIYPLTFRGNEQFFESLGFTPDDIASIYRFLAHYRAETGKELEIARRDS
jgi:hypothetical protein